MNDEVESVTARIAEDLRSGAFPPGTWLKQIDLQDRYGVGRPSVRKALEALVGRRLIRHELNRGFSVHPVDSDETRQILEIRRVIETGFAPVIAANATPDDIARIMRLATQFEEQFTEGDFGGLYETNLAFHRALLGCSGNEAMVGLVDDLRLRTSPAPASQWQRRQRIEQSMLEHHQMVEAVRDRDGLRLARAIERHIAQTE